MRHLAAPSQSIRAVSGKAQQLAEANVSAVRVLEEERRIGLNDPHGFFDARCNLKSITEWTPEQAACVASFETCVFRLRFLAARREGRR
jgi:hypothetical protein